MPERQQLAMESRVLLLEREFDRLDKQVNEYSDIKQQVAVLRTEFRAFATSMEKQINDLETTFESDVKGLRRTLIGTGLSVIVAALGFAITALAVFGGP